MSQQTPNRSIKDKASSGRKQPSKQSTLRYYTSRGSSSSKMATRSAPYAIERPDPNSKHVVVNGKDAILGSDAEDSEEELLDLHDILQFNRPRLTSVQKKSLDKNKPDSQIILDDLIKETEMNRAREARIAALDAKLDVERPKMDIRIDEESIKAMLMAKSSTEEERERAQKTLEALKRTEALEMKTVWYFFMDPENLAPPSRQKFPKSALPNEKWAELLSYPISRDSSVRAGFLSSIASHKPLSSELIKWILSEIPCEPRSDIVGAYIDALVSAGRNFSNPLTSSALQNLFVRLGAREFALSMAPLLPVQEPVLLNHKSSKQNRRSIPPNTIHVVRLLRNIAFAQPDCKFPPSSIPQAVQILILLSIDELVRTQPEAASLREDIRETISALVLGIPAALLSHTLERTALPLFEAVSDPVLRWYILAALPVYPPAAHRLRRRLALAWTLENERWVKDIKDGAFDSAIDPPVQESGETLPSKSRIAEVLTARIVRRLAESPEWTLQVSDSDTTFSDSTTHVALAARTRTLDVAIDDGFFLAPDTLSSSKPKNSPAPKKEKENEKEIEEDPHSQHISSLVSAVREASSIIVTTGASHISRLEAKAAMDRLEHRLRHAVRRTPEKTKDWYSHKENDDLRKWFVNPHDDSNMDEE